MMHASAASARVAVARLARSDLGDAELMLEVADRVQQAVPFEAGGLLLLDPETLLPVRAETLGWIRVDTRALLRNEVLTPDVFKFGQLAYWRAPAATMNSLGARAYDSERRTEIFDPVGLGDEMRVVFRHKGSSWGGACLMRASDTRAFDTDELQFMRDVAAEVGRGLQRSLARRGAATSAAAPGVMLLNSEMEVAWTSDSARRWQELMPEQSMIALQAVALRAHDPAADASSRRASIRLTSGEWLIARAAPLETGSSLARTVGDPDPAPIADPDNARAHGMARLTAVTLAPAEGRELAQLMVRVHGLTRRERQVASLMLSGLPREVAAQKLSISGRTLRNHLTSIFDKVDVNNRAQLTAVLSGALHRRSSC